MGIFNFGSDLKDENKDLKTINKKLREENDAFEEKYEDLENEYRDRAHDLAREQLLRDRAVAEKHEDEVSHIERAHRAKVANLELEQKIALEELEDDEDETIEILTEELEDLNSQNRTLQLKLDEKQADSKLAIRAAELAAREEAVDEIKDLEVKLAKSEAAVATAKAEGNAKDIVIKVYEKQLGVSEDRTASQFDTLVEKLPDVALDKFLINIEVPAPVTVAQKSEQKQEQKKQ